MAQHIALGSLSHKQNRGQFSPTKEVKKLKIQLSDRIFELKKLQEDYAEEKAHLLMQFTHERNQLNSTIRELKQKLAEQNEHWTNKVDELRLLHKQQLQSANQRWMAKIQQQVSTKMQQATKKYESQISELKKVASKTSEQLKQKEKNYEKSLFSVRQNWKAQIAQLREEYETEKEQFKTKMVKDEELKINAIMHIKNSEQKQHLVTKNLLCRQRKESDEIIRKLEERVFSLGQQIWGLNNKIQKLENESKNQTQQIAKLEESRKNSLQMSTVQYEQKIQKSEQEWKQNLCSLNEKWKGQYKKLQLAYEKVSNACIEKERLWQQRGNKVLKLYQSRQARQEDVKLIEHLEVQLIKKQFQLQREKQQLKFCKLQLDNMDDIYKRIFHSVKKNHRHSHSFQLKKMRLPGISNKTNPIKPEQE